MAFSNISRRYEKENVTYYLFLMTRCFSDKVLRVKGKVKLNHVRPELYEDFMRIHQKVHQEILVNNELSVAFARAFAYEYCKTMKEATNLEMYRIAWALASEASIERCWKMGNLQ